MIEPSAVPGHAPVGRWLEVRATVAWADAPYLEDPDLAEDLRALLGRRALESFTVGPFRCSWEDGEDPVSEVHKLAYARACQARADRAAELEWPELAITAFAVAVAMRAVSISAWEAPVEEG